jgi:serine/threonine protein kinase
MTISDAALRRLARGFAEPNLEGTRYEIVSVLGRGGMGVVFLARDRVLDREVALKVVEAPVQAFRDEALILATLEHPGIVPIHDFGTLPDGRPFYAMKRVRGERLDRWAAGAPLMARLSVFLRIADAVAFAHAHGVVHRDLKPENVMVGEFGEVLVLDWGVARLLDTPDPRRIVGTPRYMAPEQASGREPIDGRADVYALGVILSELAAGVRPLEAAAARASALVPDDRYADVPLLAAEVLRFVAGDAVSAYRESVSERVARFVRRYRVPIALVAAYLLMRLVLLWTLRI